MSRSLPDALGECILRLSETRTMAMLAASYAGAPQAVVVRDAMGDFVLVMGAMRALASGDPLAMLSAHAALKDRLDGA